MEIKKFVVKKRNMFLINSYHILRAHCLLWYNTAQLVFTCSKLTIETLEQRCKICSKLTINFEHSSHLCSSVSIFNFEHVIAGLVYFVLPWGALPININGRWMTHLHRIEEISTLISLLWEYETNAITRNAMLCNNRDDLLNLSFILKIPIFSEEYLTSRTYMVQRFSLRKSSVGFNLTGNTRK